MDSKSRWYKGNEVADILAKVALKHQKVDFEVIPGYKDFLLWKEKWWKNSRKDGKKISKEGFIMVENKDYPQSEIF